MAGETVLSTFCFNILFYYILHSVTRVTKYNKELWIAQSVRQGIDRVFANKVTKFRAPCKRAIYGPAERQLAAKAWPCSTLSHIHFILSHNTYLCDCTDNIDNQLDATITVY